MTLPKQVILTNSKVIISDTSKVSVMNEFSLPHFRNLIGMDTFFAISASDFIATNVQISRYQMYINQAKEAIDTLVAGNNSLSFANFLLQSETAELRNALQEADNMNVAMAAQMADNRKKNKRQKYIYGVGGTGLGLVGGIILGVMIAK